MSAFHTAIQDFLEAVETESHRDIGTRAHRVLELVEHIDQPDASWGLMALVPLLTDTLCPYHAMTACLCEPLMRQGGDPWLVTGLLVERLRDSLRHASEFRQEFRARCQAKQVSPEEELEARGEVWKELARERGLQAYLAGSLELFCMPAIPILGHFPQARQLFRADPQALDRAFLLASDVPELTDLIRVLDENPDQLEPADVAIQAALEQLRATLGLGPDARREVAAALMGLYRSLFCVEQEQRNRALRGLAELLETADAGYLGDMGQLAGSLVETGGDPDIALDAILARLPEVLQQAGAFVTACREAGPGEPEQLLDRYGEAVAERQPRQAQAFQSAGPLCLGAIAMLSRSVEARKHCTDDEELMTACAAVGELVDPAGFLWKMLRVIDDGELLVLEPQRERGWRLRMRGVADNFQLHTLLAGCLIGPAEEGYVPGVVGVTREGMAEDATPGRPLDRRAVNLARRLPCTRRDLIVWSHLQLWTWKALQPDGTLPEAPTANSNYFVWNEGVPADIPLLDEVRVVLIGEASHRRSWNGGRVFHGMHAEVIVEEALSVDEVRDWLHRMASAPRL